MYFDVLRIIADCEVENIIVLYDGDCRNISTKALEKKLDLFQRPGTFLSSIERIRELLKDTKADIYFAHVKSEVVKGEPKGLDDILVAMEGNEKLLLDDLTSFSKPGIYFFKENITNNMKRVYKYFHTSTAESFYDFHAETIKGREFTFKGTQYQLNDKDEIQIKVPREAKNYFRVGDQYFEFVKVPNKFDQLEKQYHKRSKETIKDDFGPKFITHVPKYKAFCNVPNHTNYTQIIHACFNVYNEFEWEPEEGEITVTKFFLQHIFEEHYEYGLDYIQLLYQRPTQILPILCLVSKENETGKSTFLKWLKAIFTQNATVIGNQELSNDFNASYASRLLVMCEESFIEKKQIVEKIKALSTADKIMMNQKGRDHVEIDFFGKFILASNNEDSFIYANDEDRRYWVRKVKVPGKIIPRLLEQLIEEIPAFLYFLNNRQLSTKNETRMHFDPKLLETEALQKLRENNRPTIEKELRERIRNWFIDFGEFDSHEGRPAVFLTTTMINELFFRNKYEQSYLSKVIREKFNVDYYKNGDGMPIAKACKIPEWGIQKEPDGTERTVISFTKRTGKPFVFYIEDFLSDEERASIGYEQSETDELPY